MRSGATNSVTWRNAATSALACALILLCANCGPAAPNNIDAIRNCVVNGTPADQMGDGKTWLLGTVEILINGQLVCSGTLIKNNVVISAAHCFADGNGIARVSPVNLSVAAGHVVQGGVGYEVYGVSDYMIDKDFDPNGSLGHVNDLAVIILADPIFYGPTPMPVLPPEMVDTALTPGRDVLVAGYGASQLDENGCPSDVGTLNLGTSTVRRVVGSEIETMVQAGEADTCNGDSGGPLYYTAPNGTIYLAGIVSRGSKNTGPICGAGGIYTLASDYLGTIENYISIAN